MEIGIISDTHNLVRPEVYEAFEGTDLILHAGDIGEEDVIIELEAIAPVRAVRGNNDFSLSERFKEKSIFQIENRTFHLLHIFRDIPKEPALGKNPVSRVVVFGHSHKPHNEHIGETLYFNPGSAGPRRFNLPCTVGRLSVKEESIEGKIIHLD